MPFLNCPYCSEPAWVVRIIEDSELTCKRCGRPYRSGNDSSGGAMPVRGRPVESSSKAKVPAPWQEDIRSASHLDADEIGTIADWQKVRLGISLITAGLWIGMLGLMFACCGSVHLAFNALSSQRFPAGNIMLFLVILLGVFGIRLLLQIIGIILCLFAPRYRGAKALAGICLVLALGSISLALAEGITHAVSTGDPMSVGDWSALLVRGRTDVFALIGSMLDFANLIVFFFFLRSLALAIHDDNLLASVRQVLIVGGTVLLLIVGLVVVGILATRNEETDIPQKANVLLTGMLCSVSILAIGWFIWYLIALAKSRTALANYIARRMHD